MSHPRKSTIRLLAAVGICFMALCLLCLPAFAEEEEHTPTILDVKQFGAAGDGVTDDTLIINLVAALLREGDTLYFPSGTYRLKENGDRSIIRVFDKKNITVLLEEDAVLRLDAVPDKSTGSETRHYIFHFLRCENLTVQGGRLYGDRLLYQGEAFVQHGYGIRLADCRNVKVKDVEIAHMRGDGISVFSDTNDENGLRGRCYDVTVEDCHIYDCQRNGITLTSVVGFTVRNTEIHGIRGSLPEAAIDIEAEYEGSGNHNVRIEGCHFYDNGSWSMTVAGDAKDLVVASSVMEDRVTVSEKTQGIRFEGCTLGMVGIHCVGASFDACTINAICLYGGETVCTNCTFDGKRAISYRVLVTHRDGVAKGRFENCEFRGRGLSALGGCIVLCDTNPESLRFEDCDFRACGLIPFMGRLGSVERSGCFFGLGWALWLCIFAFSALIFCLVAIGRKKRKRKRAL